MKRTTESEAGKGTPKADRRKAPTAAPASDGALSGALAALHGLRFDLQQALARVETAIAEIERPPVGEGRPDAVPDGPQGATARAKRPAPLREKGERGRRAPVLPGRRTPPKAPDTPKSAESPGDGT